MPAANDKNYEELRVELKQAKDDLVDAQERIKKIEIAIWGKDPLGIEPDPNAMINILRDIRDKMPDLKQVAEDSKFNKRGLKLVFGSGGIIATILLTWQLVKLFV